MARRWSGQTSGSKIPHIHVYICEGCGGRYNGKKPAQCQGCDSMAFIHFPSKAEARRYGELTLEQRAGWIEELELQPRFPLHGVLHGGDGANARVKIGEYRGDFRYKRKGKTIIEDVKGADTPLSAWKRKHVEAEYGIKIEIVKR